MNVCTFLFNVPRKMAWSKGNQVEFSNATHIQRCGETMPGKRSPTGIGVGRDIPLGMPEPCGTVGFVVNGEGMFAQLDPKPADGAA